MARTVHITVTPHSGGWTVTDDEHTFEDGEHTDLSDVEEDVEARIGEFFANGFNVYVDDELMLPYAASAKELGAKVQAMMPDRREAEWYFDPSYSGRGMFGNKSAIALRTGVAPESKTGKALQKLGFRVDNMGKGYIFYWPTEEVQGVRASR